MRQEENRELPRQDCDLTRATRLLRRGGGLMGNPPYSKSLCGLRLGPSMFLYVPVRKQVFVSAIRTFPCVLVRIHVHFVKHAHDQVTLQTHRRLTYNPLFFNTFRHIASTSVLSFIGSSLINRARIELLDGGKSKTAPCQTHRDQEYLNEEA